MVDKEQDDLLVLKLRSVSEIRSLAQYYFLPEKTNADKDPDFLRKHAEATAAVEVVCSLLNIFGVMADLRQFSPDLAVSDLTFSLNTNIFWIKYTANLMPLVSSAVNSFMDAKYLQIENQDVWRDLYYHSRYTWLEILPAICFCLRGHAYMREKSLEIKKSFSKFLSI